MELRNKVVRLDNKVFGVQQPAVGPFQRRLQEIGVITPLVFGQYGEASADVHSLIEIAGRELARRHTGGSPGAARSARRTQPLSLSGAQIGL